MRYEESHPWITFKATDLNEIGPRDWMLLGEARSKCEHLAGTPLKPEVARHLWEVTLIKGAMATTAIEGNTLTEEQVKGIFDGTYKAPPSRAYQEREVKNVIEALVDIDQQIMTGDKPVLTLDLICEYNRRVLDGLELEEGVVPGEVRTYSVGVPGYVGAPAEDCEFLLGQLSEWLEGPTFENADPEIGFALTLARAMYAHLYIAWIHPFGDGNGRTARLVEFAVLARSGMVPLPAAHLLSNHYNLTRDRYYSELARASRTGGDTRGFVAYAVQGFIDGIREQIGQVRDQQFHVAWINYVHEVMGRYPSTKARDRQREVVLTIGPGQIVTREEITVLSPKLVRAYHAAGPRTLSRDLNRLLDAGLLFQVGPDEFRLNDIVIYAFMPPVADIAE